MADGGANGPDYAVDLSNCDREPIHVLGKVQPFGFLIALTADWLVARVSANSADFIGLSPDDMLGRPISDILASDAIHALRNRISQSTTTRFVVREFLCPERKNRLIVVGNNIHCQSRPRSCRSCGSMTRFWK